MIEFVKGDIFQSGCSTLVNPVNLEGVMGAGLAKKFKETFPLNFKIYKEVCGGFHEGLNVFPFYKPFERQFYIGDLLFVRDMLVGRMVSTPVVIINLPTKIFWKHPSKLSYIQEGLVCLNNLIEAKNIKNIAIPALGCGLGGLDWNDVKQTILSTLPNNEQVTVKVYEPND